jgi:riboflavin biosynthesis pyrimidine reductase
MFIEAMAVMTINGLTTVGDKSPAEWASVADQKKLQQKLAEYQDGIAIVGSGTVGSDPSWYVQRALQGGPRRVVMTSRPNDYRDFQHPGQIEFVDFTPAELVNHYEKQGIEKGLLLAGEKVMGAFLAADLIDRFSLTIEPRIVGQGKSLAIGIFDRDFRLAGVNTQEDAPNTVFIRYDRNRKP